MVNGIPASKASRKDLLQLTEASMNGPPVMSEWPPCEWAVVRHEWAPVMSEWPPCEWAVVRHEWPPVMSEWGPPVSG